MIMDALHVTLTNVLALLPFWFMAWFFWSRQRGVIVPTVEEGGAPLARDPPLVSVIVPARNEAPHVATCVRSLLAQDYPNLEIIVVDDGSTDETGTLVEELAKGDSRLTLIRGASLPEGWMGKAHACYQGYARANGSWLLFTDADTEHAPYLLSGVMAAVSERGASVATVIGHQRHPTFAVYVVNLAVFTCMDLTLDLKKLMDPRSAQSLVNGQYVLFSREAYETIGTHAAVRSFSSTDVSLGYLAKLQGWVPTFLKTETGLSTTMYRSFSEAFQGWTRSVVNGSWTALGPVLGSVGLVLLTTGLWLLWVHPWWRWMRSLADGHSAGLVISTLQILAGSVVIRLYRPTWIQAAKDTLLLPVGFVLFTIIVVVGLVKGCWYGGTVWKGRVVRTQRGLPPWKNGQRSKSF
jgi:chlorobactene glucosyltransferase